MTRRAVTNAIRHTRRDGASCVDFMANDRNVESSTDMNPSDEGRELDDTVELPAIADDDDLMTRKQVAYKFGVTSATVKNWSKSNAVALTDVGDQGKPRYRRSEVESLFESGFRGFESRSAASRLRKR